MGCKNRKLKYLSSYDYSSVWSELSNCAISCLNSVHLTFRKLDSPTFWTTKIMVRLGFKYLLYFAYYGALRLPRRQATKNPIPRWHSRLCAFVQFKTYLLEQQKWLVCFPLYPECSRLRLVFLTTFQLLERAHLSMRDWVESRNKTYVVIGYKTLSKW